MDTQTILALAGICVTVLLGFWAIVVAVRYSRSVQITYAHEQAIALTDDITQNFPHLKVLFRDQPVSDNLVLLKGYFINTGKKDISAEMIEKQITLKLPSDFEWIEGKVVECSSAMKAKATIVGQTEVVLETGLWKVGEYVKVEALAKVPVVKVDPDNIPAIGPARRLHLAMTFPHRIADSKKILETRLQIPHRQAKTSRICGIRLPPPKRFSEPVLSPLALIVMGAYVFCFGHFFPDKNIGYRMTIEGRKHVMSLGVKGEKIVLAGDDGFRKEFTVQEFEQIADKHPEIVTSGSNGILKIGGLVAAGVGVLLLVVVGALIIRENRLLSIIAGKEGT